MAQTQLTGAYAGTRLSSTTVRYVYPTGLITSTAVKFARIIASTVVPVIVEAQVCVTTIDATEDISVGNSSSGTELINAASLGTAATGGTFLPASNGVGKYLYTADTDLWFFGSAGSDTGVALIILDITTVNTSTLTGI